MSGSSSRRGSGKNNFLKAIFFLVVFVGVLVFYSLLVHSTLLDEGWNYRKNFNVTTNSSVNLTDFQFLLELDTLSLIGSGKVNSDGSDLRFTDSAGNLLNYWIESGLNTAATQIWVRGNFSASGSSTFLSKEWVDDGTRMLYFRVRDVNGDGVKDIIYVDTGDGKVYAVHSTNRSQIWSSSIPGVYALEIADLEGDGTYEIIAGTSEYSSGSRGDVYVLNISTGEVLNSKTDFPNYRITHFEVVDINGDSNKEIIFVGRCSSGNFCAPLIIAHSNLTIIHQASGYDTCGGFPSVIDLDGDDYFDLIMGVGDDDPDGRFLRINLSSNFETVFNISIGDNTESSDPILIDLDHDGELEIVHAVDDYAGDADVVNSVFVFEINGTQKWNYSSGPVEDPPAVGDMDHDGDYELVGISQLGELFLLNESGGEQWRINASTYYSKNYESPILADVDGDSDLEIIVSTGQEGIRLYDMGGSEIYSYSLDGLDLSGFTTYQIEVTNIDDDPYLEILAFFVDWTNSISKLIVLETKGYGPKRDIFTRHKDYRRNPVYDWLYDDTYFLWDVVFTNLKYVADSVELNGTAGSYINGSLKTGNLSLPSTNFTWGLFTYNTNLPIGTNITAEIYNSSNDVLLSTEVQNGTTLNLNETSVYIIFNLTTNGTYSPKLKDYTLKFTNLTNLTFTPLDISANVSFYMYYGNSSASNYSNLSQTFSKDTFSDDYLRGYWNFDEGSGTQTNDSSGNGFNCTVTSASWNGEDGGYWYNRTDQILEGDSIYFDGSTSFLDCGSHQELIGFVTKDFSVEFWFNSSAQSTSIQQILGYFNSGNFASSQDSYQLQIERSNHGTYPNRLALRIGDGGAANDVLVYGDDALGGDNLWHHVVAGRNSSFAYIFVDGVMQSETSATIAPLTYSSASQFRVGKAWDDYPYWYKGSVDAIRIFSRSLDSAEIEAHYQRRDYTFDSVSSLSFGVEESSDTTAPTFTTIPANQSLFYLNQTLNVTFVGTDETGLSGYTINDTTNFQMGFTSGFLINNTPLAAGNFSVNVSINDSSNNINWTIFTLEVNKSLYNCNVLFNESSPLKASQTFLVYTDCSSGFQLYRNGSIIGNNSEQSLSENSYNFSVLRNDTANYSNILDDEWFVLDDTSPTANITSPINTTYTSSSVSLFATTNENSTCNYSTDGGTTNSSLTANSTGTGHTGTLSSLSTGSYTLNAYCSDIAGNQNNSESVSFSVSIASTSTNTGSTSSPRTNSGGGSSSTFVYDSESLKRGFSKDLKKDQAVKTEVKSQEKIINIESVDSGKAVVEIEGKSYSVDVDSSVKVDLDNDGVYDLEISNSGSSTTGLGDFANLEFKEISEDVEPGKEEEQKENVFDKIFDSDKEEEEKKISFWEHLINFLKEFWERGKRF